MTKTQLKIYWLYALIISFAYERQLVQITSMERLNPRLYDVILGIGLFLFWKDLFKKNKLPKPIVIWKYLIFWFAFCALIWTAFFLPLDIGLFSIFFAYRYIVGVLTLYLVATTLITPKVKGNIHLLIIYGGVFVGFYAIYQFLNPQLTVEIAGDKTVTFFQNIITGPFGFNYFHIAQYSSIAFIFALVYAIHRKTFLKQIFWSIISLFVAWPLFFCGSRTAIAYFGLGLVFIVTLKFGYFLKFIIPILFIFVLAYLGGFRLGKVINSETSVTLSRIGSKGKGHHNSVENRLKLWKVSFPDYMHKGLSMPFIGAGFYVAAVKGNHRIGYGLHNNYLFIFEQSGVIGLLLFFSFLFSIILFLQRMWRKGQYKDRLFAFSAMVYMMATILLNISGQIFIRGYNTNNLNTFILCVLCIALMHSQPTLSKKIN